MTNVVRWFAFVLADCKQKVADQYPALSRNPSRCKTHSPANAGNSAIKNFVPAYHAQGGHVVIIRGESFCTAIEVARVILQLLAQIVDLRVPGGLDKAIRTHSRAANRQP